MWDDSTLERFWAKVDKTPGQGPNGDCWIWTGARQKFGYGCFGLRRGTNDWIRPTAHRVSYMIASGRDPSPLGVCHSCDNPPCVNPAHLWVGTPLDNIRDVVSKGRMKMGGEKRRGDSNGLRKHPERASRGDAWQKAHAATEAIRLARSHATRRKNLAKHL